jgi:iron-sulfur cluster assembly accessory protein
MITVTPSAVKHLRELLQETPSSPTAGLRLSVEKGGCAGWQYTMKVGDPAGNDEIYELDGVRVIVDQASISFLTDSCIDYSDSLNDAGFKVTNPNAARSCGCGTSFEPLPSNN